LTAAIYETDTGRELRVGFSLTNLIHSELSCTGDGPLEARAEDLRVSLLESGWIELRATNTAHLSNRLELVSSSRGQL
jgi:hypothetical protein